MKTILNHVGRFLASSSFLAVQGVYWMAVGINAAEAVPHYVFLCFGSLLLAVAVKRLEETRESVAQKSEGDQ